MKAPRNSSVTTRIALPALLCVLMLALSLMPPAGQLVSSPYVAPTPSASPVPVDAAYDMMAGAFTENIGQVDDPSILFYSASGSAAFTKDSVILYFFEPASEPGTRSGIPVHELPLPSIRRGAAISLSFPGANDVSPVGVEPAGWKSNYIMGNDPAGWRTGASNFNTVLYRNLWDGIDLAYRMGDDGMKYEMLVAPGADHGLINVKVSGHEDIESSGSELRIALSGGHEVIDGGLDVFYADDPDEKINARFQVDAHGTYSFSIYNRDMARAMVIDPLIYSTYLGGAGTDRGNGIALDSLGCAYVVGHTDSPNFPVTSGAFETDYNGYSEDIFVAKLNPLGSALEYCTFMGDVGRDIGSAIAVDTAGNAYITGYTGSNNFPTTPGAFDRTYNGDAFDAFIAKLSPSGDSLAYSTLLGGLSVDTGCAIFVDAAGYAYVTGDTWSFNFPLSPDAMDRVFNAGQTGGNDVFITKLSQAGDALVYSTFLGGSDIEYATGLAVDVAGFAYVTGYTRSQNFPATSGSFDNSFNGGYDAFVTKIGRSGSSMVYSTFLGGDNSDFGQAIALGGWGEVYVTGYTHSDDFPTTPGAFGRAKSGWADVFVTALNRYGNSLIYSTLLGGSEGDYAYAIAIDKYGCAHVAGSTASYDFPTTPGAFGRTYSGNGDAFVLKLSSLGNALAYSTYLGGSGQDIGTGVDVDVNGFTLVTGYTTSVNYPMAPDVFDDTYNGLTDTFITKLDMAEPTADAGPDQQVPESSNVTFDGSGSRDNHGIVNYTWIFQDGIANFTLYGPKLNHTFMVSGTYAVALTVQDASGNRDNDTMFIMVLDITAPIAVAGDDQIVDEGSVVEFNGTASTDNVGIASHTWSFRHGNRDITLLGQSPEFTFTVPGIYDVEYSVADAAGNTANDTVRITVNDITPPSANAGIDRRIHKNTEMRFNGTASRDNVAIVSYTWSFDDGSSAVTLQGPEPSHRFTVEGVFQVTLEVQDAVGHKSSDIMAVTVLEIISPVAVAGPDIAVDEGVPMRFDGSASTDNVAVARWSWSFNDGVNDVVLLGVSPSWVFTIPGTYHATLNASDAADNWDTDTMSVTVRDTMPPTASAGPNQMVAEGSLAMFDGSGSRDSSGLLEHTWAFKHNGTLVTLSGESQSFRFWTPGTYTVTLTVTDAAGNAANDTMTLTVLPPAAQVASGPGHWWAAMIILAIIASLALIFFKPGGRKVKGP